VSAVIRFGDVPVIEAARTYVREGNAPGGTHANWRFLADWVEYEPSLSKEDQLLLADAQTSGGMLIAVAPDKVPVLLDALARQRTLARAVIGEIVSGTAGHAKVVA
jgi:selenide,water dikinase